MFLVKKKTKLEFKFGIKLILNSKVLHGNVLTVLKIKLNERIAGLLCQIASSNWDALRLRDILHL